MNACQYNVYLKTKGDNERKILAAFTNLIDACNYACAESAGRYAGPEYTVLALNIDHTVFRTYKQGISGSGSWYYL